MFKGYVNSILLFAAVSSLAALSTSCRGGLKVHQDREAPEMEGLVVTNTSPSHTQTFQLSHSEIGSSYAYYCILENSTSINLCDWKSGELPASYDVSPLNGAKVLSAWLRDENGNVSDRVDTNSVTLEIPYITSATITNSNPSLSTTFNLSYGTIIGAYSHYCILENDTTQGSCSWTAGTLPSSYTVTSTMNAKILSVWLKDSNGNISTRVDTNSVNYGELKLTSKNLKGTPGGSATITYTGATYSNLQVKFRDHTSRKIFGTSSVSSSGGVTLPSRAGVYDVELKDLTSNKFSYGIGTFTNAITNWLSSQTITLSTFAQYRTWPDWSRTFGDYDGDGYLDFAYADGAGGGASNPGIYLYKYNSTLGTFAFDTRLINTQAQIYGIRFVDMDNDGDLDLVYTIENTVTFAGGLCMMLNTAGTYGAPTCLMDAGTTSAARTYYYEVEVADIDGDGYPEVFVAGGDHNGAGWTGARIEYFKNNAGTLSLNTVLDAADTIRLSQIRIGDYNDDGRLDIIASGGDNAAASKLYRYAQRADGTFNVADKLTTAISGGFGFAMAYLNGDSKLDFIASCQGNSTVYYLQSNTTDDTLASSGVPVSSEQIAGANTIADIFQTGTPQIFLSPKNRLLYNNKSGIYYKTVANLTSAITASAANSIVGATTMSNWAEATSDFYDLNNDGTIDLMYESMYSPFLEVIRGQ